MPHESIEQILSELQINFQDTEDEIYIARISNRIAAAHDRAIGRLILTHSEPTSPATTSVKHVVDVNNDVFILRDTNGVPIQIDFNGKTYDVIENTLLTKKDK